MDTLAAKLQNNLIDRKFAKSIIGKAYCTQIESLYPIISNHRSKDKESNYFNALIELYKDWNKS
jgi:hypothetical protein